MTNTKNLWAPWRMEHVLGRTEKVAGCLFEPPGNSPCDPEFLLLYRDPLTVILLNRFPYANGHLLIAPRRHVGDITDLSQQENQAIMTMLQQSCTILRHHLQPDGFNIGLNVGTIAGAGIADHLHFHIVPRWQGDHNFMTVTGDIRTIPEHISRTFELLVPDFKQLLPGDK
ncbi:MAG: HIT domain-containing protein [Thermodesulfobacteriota bacterium]|nr:HIT domain-containing protein [Thermodesulfobacteriota bacterium]